MTLAACSSVGATGEGAHIALAPLADAHAAALDRYQATLPDEVLITGARLICGVDALDGEAC